MNKRLPIKFIILLGISGISLFGCEKTHTNQTSNDGTSSKPNVTEVGIMNELKLHDPYEFQDINNMPATVPMTDEQKKYLIEITNAVLRVIKKETPLEKEETLFGAGEFFWPKDPKKPIKVSKSYQPNNFKVNYLALGFRRASQKDIWNQAGFTIEPKNFPHGVYVMDMPASFFSDYELDKSTMEERPDEAIKRVNVFQFHLKGSKLNVKLQFEAREDVSNLQDKYPNSFHYLKIMRIEE